jgi:hypothetical protein
MDNFVKVRDGVIQYRIGTQKGVSLLTINNLNSRLDAMHRRNRRDYWTGMAVVTGLGLMQVPFLVAAWRLFCPS